MPRRVRFPREVQVLGPLPLLHRTAVVSAVLVVFVGLGVWMGLAPAVPVLILTGAVFGVLSGALVSWLVVHDPHDPRGPHLRPPRH